MKEDTVSQLIRHAIEKIEKIPKTTLVEILESLYREREYLITFLNFSLRRGVFIIDSSGRILFFNDFCAKLGILRETGGSWRFEEGFEEHVSKALKTMEREKDTFYSTEVQMSLESGRVATTLSGKVLKIECSTRDFETFYFVVSDRTDEVLGSLDRMQEESLSSLANVVLGVAHEIKNPLSAMYFHTKILRKVLDKEPLDRDYILREVEIILSEIDRLNGIVNNIIFSLRPYKFAEKYENINEVVKEVVDFFLPEFREKGIMIEVILDEAIPMVLCDKSLIKQAVINLVKNSIDAVRGKEERVIEIKTYFLSKFDGDFVVIEVKDNGIGIPESVKSRIFEPFFTTKEEGSGIGLSIVYKIVKLHRGFVEFSSRDGETTFRLLFPVIAGAKELKYERG